ISYIDIYALAVFRVEFFFHPINCIVSDFKHADQSFRYMNVIFDSVPSIIRLMLDICLTTITTAMIKDNPISRGSRKTRERMKNRTALTMLDRDTYLLVFKVSRKTLSNIANIKDRKSTRLNSSHV